MPPFAKKSAVDALAASDTGGGDDGNDGSQAPDTTETANDDGTYDVTCPSCGDTFSASLDDGDGTDAGADTTDELPEMAGGGNNDTGDSADEMGFRMGGGRS